MDLGAVVSDYGFPIIAAMGMGYFIFFIWTWVTTVIDPVIGETMGTLIKLVDRVRMLDNDIIRLNTKLSMVLEHEAKLDKSRRAELEQIVSKYTDITNDPFNSTGTKD
jgi:tetrahydromethanopterin S-methyltransferase subunit E